MTGRWIDLAMDSDKFQEPAVMGSEYRTLKAGYNSAKPPNPCRFIIMSSGRFKPARIEKSPERALAMAGGRDLAGGICPSFMPAIPSTPASDILHNLAEMKRFGARTLQAEDEIARHWHGDRASFGGGLGVTATSGPGICSNRKPLASPSSPNCPWSSSTCSVAGRAPCCRPNRTSDLLQAMYGRNGECPVPSWRLAPGDCFTNGL